MSGKNGENTKDRRVTVIGAGLAGIEAACQVSRRGVTVDLYEMRPGKMTEAHGTGFPGEMVCSNSLGSTEISSASGLLKAELKMLDSFFLKAAEKNRVPAGTSLAVDRVRLGEELQKEIEAVPHINLIREEIKEIPRTDHPVIIATGPLTSPDFAQALTTVTMRRNLFFFDATTPIIKAETIDMEQAFRASRYQKGEADFLNIPLGEQQYHDFVRQLVEAEKVELKEFEKKIFFEACLPIEEIAARGPQSLAFGPLKPVGLIDPRTGNMPFAVIQLRQDDLMEHFYQLVGFQTRLKWGEQKRIFRSLPGLARAEFERYGRMHRNTYINAPLIINKFCQSKTRDNLFFAGQLSGVEGYVESVASGLIAGIFAAKKVLREPFYNLPRQTAIGSLLHYLGEADWKNFKPTKFSFGLLPPLPEEEGGGRRKLPKKQKKEMRARLAVENLDKWIKKADI